MVFTEAVATITTLRRGTGWDRTRLRWRLDTLACAVRIVAGLRCAAGFCACFTSGLFVLRGLVSCG